MNRFFKQFIFLFFLAIIVVSFSGCGKKEIVKDVQENENVEVIENKEIKNENIEIQEINEEFELKLEEGDQVDITLPQKDDWKNAKWITYRDKENGFEFKYPNTLAIADKDESMYLEHIDTMRYIKEWQEQNPRQSISLDLSVQVSIMDNDNNLSLNEWFNKDRSNIEDYILVKEFMIKDKKALRVSENSIMDNDAVFFLLNNGKIVMFHLYGMSFDYKEGSNFFVKMLESFRLV